MMNRSVRLGITLSAFGIALGYAIGAFGSVQASFGHSATVFRESARWLVLFAGITGLVLLPSSSGIPKFPKIPLICFGVLILWGTFMVLNAKSDQQLQIFRMIPNRSRLIDGAPGAVASTTAKGLVWEVGIVFVFCAMIVKSLESRAYRYILGGLALCGTVVAVVGVGHKLFGLETIYGLTTVNGRPASVPETYFAPFVYNANAASLMNLTFVLSLGLACQSCRGSGFTKNFYLWVGSAMVTAIGVVAAASKAGILIMLFQMGLFAVVEGKYLWKVLKRSRLRERLSLEKKFLLGAVGIVFLGGLLLVMGPSIARFGLLMDDLADGGGAATVEGRGEVRGIVWELIKDPQGWGGIGPGGFAHIYPYIIDPDSEALSRSRWHHAHCDPLQTILEWGYLGALAWFTIGIGGIVRVGYLRKKQLMPREFGHLAKALSIGLVGLGIHSTYDFPFSLLSIHLVALSCCMILWSIPAKVDDLGRH